MGKGKGLKSKAGKNIMSFVYGFGAAVVIVGAWGKILHLSWANIALTAGLLTEALIFVISAFDFPEEDVDWTIVYPELAGADTKGKKDGGKSATQQLDEMMSKAKIGPELIDSLGKGFQNLNENVSRMANLSDASIATNEYSKNVKDAAVAASSFSKAASTAAEAVSGMSLSSEEAKKYHEQVQSLVKNLSQINAVYELELQDSNNHLKTMNKFYGTIAESLQSLAEATEDSRKYKEEMSKLSKNLSSLNSIYGNMLTAMTTNRV